MKRCILSLFFLMFASLCFQAPAADGANAVDESALKEAEASGDVRETIRQLVICGNAWSDAGEMEKARDYCCRAFSLMKASSNASLLENSFNITNSLFTIARIYRKNNDPEKALEYLERSIEFELSLNRPHMINRRYEEKIEILIEEHHYDEAVAAVRKLRENAVSSRNDHHYLSKSYYLEGLCREAFGDTTGAQASIEKAVECADRIYLNSNHVDLPVFLNKLARYSIAKGDTVSATGYYRRAMDIIDSYGNKVLNQEVCNGLADIYAETDPEMSAEYRQKALIYDYLPGLEALASKVAIDSIDFPRREREQIIRNQRLKVIAFGSCAILLLLVLLLLLQRNLTLHKLSEARKAQNESLVRSLQQKNKLLELAQGIQDERISKEMKDIANLMGGGSRRQTHQTRTGDCDID